MSEADCRLYVFDLGNVVIKTDFRVCYDVWSRYCEKPASELQQKFRIDTTFEAFERGELSPRDYFAHFNKLLGIDITYNEFAEGWNSIYLGLHDEVVASLKRLRQQSRVVALTNTNSLHCEVWPRLYPTLQDLFETIYISNEIGLRKPDAAMFHHVLEREAVTARDIVFFDDNADNVAAACALGIRGVRVAAPQDVLHMIGDAPAARG